LAPKLRPSHCKRVAYHTKNTSQPGRKIKSWEVAIALSTTSKQIDYSDETTQGLDQPEIKDTPTIV